MIKAAALCAILLCLALAHGITDMEWASTVNVAGKQRTLSQQMTKEFLLISQGFEAAANKARLMESIREFDDALNCLLSGCPQLHVVPPPSALVLDGLQKVQATWTPFMRLLHDEMNTVRNEATGAVNFVVLERLAAENLPLLTKSDYVVSRLIDAAKAAGAETGGLVFNIAGRQRTLIQRMCKEVYLVGMGVDVVTNLANLRSTYSLFDQSHRGIIIGASWAGVPMLTQMCTLQQMREVTYEWERFKPLVGQILAETTSSKSQEAAVRLTQNISDLSAHLFTSILSAVEYYFNDSGTCTAPHISSSEWVYLLNNVGKQRSLGQKVTQLFMQIANGVDVQNSKVELTVQAKATDTHIRYLIEGSKINNIPSPPTQAITDQLMRAYSIWKELQELILGAVDMTTVESLLVRQVAALSQQHFDEMNAAVELYEDNCEIRDPTVDPFLINYAGRQRTLYLKMSKEASLISYGAGMATSNWQRMNATRDLFLKVHWQLLLGSTTAGSNNAHVLQKTTHRCLVQKMKVVEELFEELHTAALDVARGNRAGIGELIRLNPLAFDAMNTAVGWYAALPQEPTCEPLHVSYDEWLGAITQLGKLRSLTQKAASSYLMAHYGGAPSDLTALASSVSGLGLSVRKVEFGSGAGRVPAPFSQEVLDNMFNLAAIWTSYEQLLNAATMGAGDAERVSLKGLEVLAEAENVMTKYVTEAQVHTHPSAMKENRRVPVDRVNIASRQAMLANKMVKEALLARFASAQTGSDMAATIGAFEAAHRQLKDGGGGVQAIIPERGDLTAQWDRVNGLWQTFRGQVRSVALVGAGNQDVYRLLQALKVLEDELNAATLLFAIHDPIVVPEEARFPFTALAYGALFVFLAIVVCIACYTSARVVQNSRKSGSSSPGGNNALSNV